uniref:SEA domain-containing protein n=1 Tax=Castor canadensis TaxID=51338 RepID=A0A8C0X470_CASCN
MTRGFQVPFFLLLLLIPTTLASPSSNTVANGTNHSTGTPLISSNHSSQLSVGVSFFFLSFYILNRQYNSSLENPNTDYYQELKENISGLAVCQCRRKNYGQLDIFPTRDAYHPMSEYPTYHTHGRYVPPGSTKRSPYEEISSGNGGSGLSYTNPAAAVTSANL